MKNKKILAIVLAAVSVIVAAVSFIVLPETVIIQFSAGPTGYTTAPKLISILLSSGLALGGAIGALCIKDNEKSSGKSLIVSVAGILVGILVIVVNTLIK